MAWPEGTPAWLKNQWGVISGQVSARATTAQLIDSLRPYAAAAPEGWGPRGVIQVSQLRSMAVSIRTASDAISAQGLTGTLLDKHIAEAPWSRSPIQQSLAPQYQVRALVSSENPEAIAGVQGVPNSIDQWVSLVSTELPSTIDELIENVIQNGLVTGSPVTPITGVSKLEILRE